MVMDVPLDPHPESSRLTERMLRHYPDGAVPLYELPAAARRTLHDAEILHGGGRYHTAAYLAGYAAEMSLGYCYARFQGVPHSYSASALLRPARSKAVNLLGAQFVDQSFRNGHSPLFWWKLLLACRDQAGMPLPPELVLTVDQTVRSLQRSWDVWLRYLPSLATRKESESILEATKLIASVSWKLWRRRHAG